MHLTTLGRGGPRVSRAGLGLMGMSGVYGPADDEESVATGTRYDPAQMRALDSER